MNRTRLLLAVLLAASAAFPAAALAHRQASKAERAAILTAVVRQHQLSGAQAACQVVTISTVNRGYATVTWPKKLPRACLRVAANGLIIERRAARGWMFVTVGSSFHCPINGVPTGVARDLNICS